MPKTQRAKGAVGLKLMFLRHCAGTAAAAAPLNATFTDSRDSKTIVNTPSTVPNNHEKI